MVYGPGANHTNKQQASVSYVQRAKWPTSLADFRHAQRQPPGLELRINAGTIKAKGLTILIKSTVTKGEAAAVAADAAHAGPGAGARASSYTESEYPLNPTP